MRWTQIRKSGFSRKKQDFFAVKGPLLTPGPIPDPDFFGDHLKGHFREKGDLGLFNLFGIITFPELQ